MTGIIISTLTGIVAGFLSWFAANIIGPAILAARSAREDAIRVTRDHAFDVLRQNSLQDDKLKTAVEAFNNAAEKLWLLATTQPLVARGYCMMCGWDFRTASELMSEAATGSDIPGIVVAIYVKLRARHALTSDSIERAETAVDMMRHLEEVRQEG